EALPLFRRFMTKHSGIELLFLRRRGFEIGALIEKGQADFGYLPLEYCPPTLHWHKFGEFGTFLIIPRRYPLARERRITLQKLSKYPLIIPDRNASAGWRIHRAFQANHVEYRVRIETVDSRLVTGFAREGLGVGILQEEDLIFGLKKYCRLVD